jgi:hypothetical protein
MLRARWPRLVSLAIGVWLVVSTLAFRTESSPGFNRLMIGIFVCCCAISAIWAPGFRFVNMGLGVWLLFTTSAWEHASMFLRLSTLAAAGALIVLSALRSPPRLIDPNREFAGYRP